MDDFGPIIFAVGDVAGGEAISPASVPLGLVSDFAADVQAFIRGSSKDVASAELVVKVVPGSFAFQPVDTRALPRPMLSDIAHLNRQDSLDLIDAKRADVVLKWQRKAANDPRRYYSIGGERNVIRINAETAFRHGKSAVWVQVEQYVVATILNMGGATKPNIHVETDDGRRLKIAATTQQIGSQEKNLLYRTTVLHLRAEQNLANDELRNPVLIAFEDYNPSFDPEAFSKLTEKGAKAWSGVPDHVEWVRKIRGH